MRAVLVEKFGGPDVLAVADVDDPAPGPGEVVVDLVASGVNFIDVYHRTGHYPNDLPFVPGSEGAGTVSALGAGVTGVRVGDRVGVVNELGTYAERLVAPANRVLPLPAGVEPATAAAGLLQGLTAQYLVRTTYPVRAGDAVLVHAAAGGMGLLLTQVVKYLGGRVVGTASTPEKAALAREAGADVVVGYADTVDAVRDFTGGEGVAVAYDGVGADTFEATLRSLRPRGYFVSYGSASGPVPPVEPLRLAGAGSVLFTRPRLVDHVAADDELRARAAEVLGWLADGTLAVRVTGRYPLAEAARAHEDLEGRRSTGKLLITP